MWLVITTGPLSVALLLRDENRDFGVGVVSVRGLCVCCLRWIGSSVGGSKIRDFVLMDIQGSGGRV